MYKFVFQAIKYKKKDKFVKKVSAEKSYLMFGNFHFWGQFCCGKWCNCFKFPRSSHVDREMCLDHFSVTFSQNVGNHW